MMDGEVSVSFEGREHKVDIEDVNPEDLRDLFGIDFDVKSMFEVETEKTVLIKKKDKFKPGFTYLILRPTQVVSDSPQVIFTQNKHVFFLILHFAGPELLAAPAPADRPAGLGGVQGGVSGPGHGVPGADTEEPQPEVCPKERARRLSLPFG